MFKELKRIKRIEKRIKKNSEKCDKIMSNYFTNVRPYSFEITFGGGITVDHIIKVSNLIEEEMRKLFKLRDKTYKKLSFIEKISYHLWKIKEGLKFGKS